MPVCIHVCVCVYLYVHVCMYTCYSESCSNQQQYACGYIEIPAKWHLDEQCPWKDVCLENSHVHTNAYMHTHTHTHTQRGNVAPILWVGLFLCHLKFAKWVVVKVNLCILLIFLWRCREWVTEQIYIYVSCCLQNVWPGIQAWSPHQQRCRQG